MLISCAYFPREFIKTSLVPEPVSLKIHFLFIVSIKAILGAFSSLVTIISSSSQSFCFIRFELFISISINPISRFEF